MESGEQRPLINSYDNDVTLLYKATAYFQVPIRLIVVRPRNEADALGASESFGNAKYIFESIYTIVDRLATSDEFTPAEILTYIQPYTKQITEKDVTLTYYDLLKSSYPDQELYPSINQFYRDLTQETNLEKNKYPTQSELDKAFQVWKFQLAEEFKREADRLVTINQIQSQLAQVDLLPKIPWSPLIIRSTEMSYSPTLDGHTVTPDDGLEIFNQAIVSKYVPYLRYNDANGTPYYRVYTGDKIEDAPNFEITVPNDAKTAAKNTIYLRLWYGDPHGDNSVNLRDSPKGLFRTIVYHLEFDRRRNQLPYLLIKSPVEEDPVAGQILGLERIRNALPNLQFGSGTEVNVQGEFNMWQLDYEEASLLEMILLEPLMNVYLYVEENIDPFAFKERLGIHYRSIYTDIAEGGTATEDTYIQNSASVSVTLISKSLPPGESIDLINPETGTVTRYQLEEETPYVHLNISQAESREIVEAFIPIFGLLMSYYQSHRQDVDDEYANSLPELTRLPSLLAQKKIKSQMGTTLMDLTKRDTSGPRETSKIKQLRALAPDLFIKSYARLGCQYNLQPIIISPDEIDQWKAQRIIPAQDQPGAPASRTSPGKGRAKSPGKGKGRAKSPGKQKNSAGVERQVMPFPKDNPKWYFVCPDDKFPYPGVKYNKNLPNKDIYPYIPCCRPVDQMVPGSNSKYQKYLEGRPANTDTCTKKIITRKILPPDRQCRGTLPSAVNGILKRYSPNYSDMVRIGIPRSPNSLLHCVGLARDANYVALTSLEEKEAYVSRIRLLMADRINPAVLKQEFYDYEMSEIMDLWRDNSKFLDPALFYRGVEELYGVNIYVFLSPPPTGDEYELGLLELPRYKIFHARPIRLDRPTVVVLKTMGGDTNNLDYPHCELIVDYNDQTETMVKIFGSDMTEICHSTLQNSYKTITSTPRPDGTFDTHANLYYYIDHLNIFQRPAVSQMIDDNGKMRSLTLDLGSTLMTIATIPSQPENLPLSSEVIPVPAQNVIELFGTPSGVTRDFNGEVDGFWIPILDLTMGEYISIIPTPGFEEIPEGPPNPIVSTAVNITERLSRLRRTLNIIVQVIKWLFELARRQPGMTPAVFVSRFMVMDQTPVSDSSTYYDLREIPRRFPIVDSVEAGIELLSPLAPTLFNENKLVMYSPVFADRIAKMLYDFYNIRIGAPPAPATLINHYYENANNFDTQPHTKVFVGERDFEAWIQSLQASQNYSKYYNIRLKIDIEMGASLDPYLYQEADGSIYLVQNVIGGIRSKALSVAETWNEMQVNIGPDPIPLDDIPIHMIYGISSSGSMIPIEDNTHDQDLFLKLLYYGNQVEYNQAQLLEPHHPISGKIGRYAAILKIL